METPVLDRSEDGARRGSGGRPTREEAARRGARLIDEATRLFMERGFDATSMDAVAEAAGVSKVTVYARYRDKRELFEAVLRGRIEAWLAPLAAAAEAQAAEGRSDDVEAALHDLSRALLAHAQSPGAAMLTRCLAAQALQFPDLARLAHEEGWLRGVRAVAQLLEVFARRGRIAIEDAEVSAELFLNLVLGRVSRMALYGIVVDGEAQEKRRKSAVAVFMNGVRSR